ncbi:MAG: MFS transporter, partial [Eggerthellaceae bacterium]|nr:MFS transporter [Eggerthellaceae bacterium]
GLATYTLGGLACALAWSVYALIAFRIVQAIGAGATVSVSTALVKDCFQPDKREKVLSILQVLNVVGPVAAPLLGGFLLRFFPWRGNLVALAIFGAICFVLSLAFEETLPVDERRQGGIISTLSGLVVVGKNRAFMQYLVAMGLLNTAFMGYIVSSSYIYQDYFGTSPQGYTYFFALTAGLASLGPIIWLRISSHTTPRRYTFVVLFLCLASGVLIITLGGTSAPLFCGLFAIFTTAQSSMRPFSTNIMLAQQKRDTGSAASLINFTISIFGVMGMSLVQISWPHYILGLGLQVTLCTLLSIFLYVTLLKSKKVHIAELEK